MVVAITEDKWVAARHSLEGTARRFAELATAAADPRATATVHWSVAETVAHVVAVAQLCRFMVGPADGPRPFADLDGMVRATVIDTVDVLNDALLRQLTERDPRALALELRSQVDQILRDCEGADPTTAVPWIGGAEVPLAGLLAHLLNELQIHGRDIARTTGARWAVAPGEAALFLDLFLVGVIDYGYGDLMEGHGPAPKGRITVEFRSKYTTPVTMAMTDGFVTVENPGKHPDARLSFDPTTLNLMMFGRISPPRALLTRKVMVTGRRPWVLPGFLRIMSLP